MGKQSRRREPLRTFNSFYRGLRDRSFVYAPGTVPTMPFIGQGEQYRINMNEYDYPDTDWGGLDFDEMVKVPLYHQSHLQKHQFMSAPFLHLGSRGSAVERTGRDSSLHSFKLNPFTNIHPEVFTDREANEAHAQALERRGIAVTGEVAVSRNFSDTDRARRAREALESNTPIIYENTAEIKMHWHPLDRRRLSMIVPSPKMNLVGRYSTRNPHPSPLLPLDYTPMEEGEVTKRHRQLWEEGHQVVPYNDRYATDNGED